MKNVIFCPISVCKLKIVIPSQTTGNLRSFWLKDESKKSDITLSVTQNSIYFQMNQKSYAGANCLGFKKFQERGNHNCGGRDQILIPPTKIKLIKSVNFTSFLENIPIFYSIFLLRNKSKFGKPMHI